MEGVRVSVKNPGLEGMLVSYQAISNKHLAPPQEVHFGREEIKDYARIRDLRDVEDEMKKYAYTPTTTENDNCELIFTELEGKSIAGFNVGGEMRLCLIQVLKTILYKFDLSEINPIFDALKVFCALCTKKQLMGLKEEEIIPECTSRCGLITKSDAQRLCSFLKNTQSDERTTELVRRRQEAYLEGSFKVLHSCFGGCQGVFIERLFYTPAQECIRCDRCQRLFTPESFVSHVHSYLENKQTCHWGFDSCNWSHYLFVDPCEPAEKEVLLDAIKNKHFKQLAAQNSISLPFPPPINIKELPFCSKHGNESYAVETPPLIVQESRHHNTTSTGDFPPNISLVPKHHPPLPWSCRRHDDDASVFPATPTHPIHHSFNGAKTYNEAAEVKSDDDDDDDDDDDCGDDNDDVEEDEEEYVRIAGMVEGMEVDARVAEVFERLQSLCRRLMHKSDMKHKQLLEKQSYSVHPPNKTLPIPIPSPHHPRLCPPPPSHHPPSFRHLQRYESSSSPFSEHTTKSDTTTHLDHSNILPKKRRRCITHQHHS